MEQLLEQVKKEFSDLHSRNSNPSKDLKTKVAKLLKNYPRKVISSITGISPGTLSNWKTRYNENNKPTPTNFIPLPMNTSTKDPNIVEEDKIDQLELILPNNFKLLIKDFSLKKSINIVRRVVEEFPLCSI